MEVRRQNPNRLFILGMLKHAGPMHGHQIRREAQLNRTELWTEVQVGALYAALHRMEAEGLVAIVRSEQRGRYPERTIYAITEEGEREFYALRSLYLRDAALRPDPFDLALSLTADLDLDELCNAVEDRARALAVAAQSIEHQRAEAGKWISERELAIFGHHILRLEAELRWHEDLLRILRDSPDATEVNDDRSTNAPAAL
jgi:DNA-binding PadR family transcriptional regulator